MVTRRGEVSLQELESPATSNTSRVRASVRVAGLPVGLVDASLAVRPSPGYVVRSATLGLARASSPSTTEAQLERQRALDAKAASLAVELDEVDRSIAILRGLRFPERAPAPDGATRGPSDVTARLALLADIAAATKDLAVAKSRLSVELERAEENARDHAQRTAEARRQGALEKVLTLDVEGSDEACSFEISYFMKRARWVPTYVLRVDRARVEATLELRASVAQATGERWDGVGLSLSTGDPHRFHALPELQSLRIGRQQPARPSGFRPLTTDPQTLFEDYRRAQASVATATLRKPKTVGGKAKKDESAEVSNLSSHVRDEPHAEQFEEGGMGGAPGAAPMPMSLAAPSPFPQQGFGSPFGGSPPKVELKASLGKTASGPHRAMSAPAKGGRFYRSAELLDDLLEADASTLANAPTHMATDDRVFAYESLRMPAFQERQGKLVLLERAALYRELWVSSGSFDDAIFLDDEQIAVSLGEPPARSRSPEPDAGFHHRLEGSVAISMAADGQYHSVPVLQLTAPVKLRHVVVPRESTDVFRRVEFMNPLDVPLLAGPCDVYVDGEFLLTTDLETVGPRGELSIPMGVEQSIRVVRNTKFAEASEGLIGGTLALRHELTVEVQNHLPHTCEIEVRERVPIPDEKEENVRVELGQVRPSWSAVRPRGREVAVKGAHAWTVELEKDAKSVLTATYIVRLPSKFELEGGNRRA